jgi:hypothetical protein
MTLVQAVMEAPFGSEPKESVEEMAPLREAITSAVDNLLPGERWLFEMLINTRLSLRFVAIVVGIPKTTLARRRDAIITKLAEQLETNPIIVERLSRRKGNM